MKKCLQIRLVSAHSSHDTQMSTDIARDMILTVQKKELEKLRKERDQLHAQLTQTLAQLHQTQVECQKLWIDKYNLLGYAHAQRDKYATDLSFFQGAY